MAGLVIGHQFIVLFGADARLFLRPEQHFHIRRLNFLHTDQVFILLGSKQRRLVEQVGKISPGEPDGGLRNLAEIHSRFHRFLARVDFENLFPPFDIGIVDGDLPVKTTGTEQCGVQNVGAVGCRHDDDALVRAETVHFHKQLVQRLLALVVSAAQARAAVTTDGVYLINEDDCRRGAPGGFKQVAHARSAHANVHFHKIRAGNGIERNVRLAGNGLGKQGFTRAGRAYEQYAVRNARAQLGIFLRVFQKFDDFNQFLFFLVGPGNVAEIDLILIALRCLLGFGAPEGIELGVLAVHGAERDEPDDHDGDDEKDHGQVGKPRHIVGLRLQIQKRDRSGRALGAQLLFMVQKEQTCVFRTEFDRKLGPVF